MKSIFQILLFLSLLPVAASGQKRIDEIGAVYGAIRSMTPEAYKEAHDKYGIRWIEAWTGNLVGGTEEQYDAWIERFNAAMKGSGLKLWSVHLPFTRKAPNDLSDDRPEWREATFKNWIEILDRATRIGKFRVVVIHPSSEAKISDEERPRRLENLRQMLVRFIPLVKQRYGAVVAGAWATAVRISIGSWPTFRISRSAMTPTTCSERRAMRLPLASLPIS